MNRFSRTRCAGLALALSACPAGDDGAASTADPAVTTGTDPASTTTGEPPPPSTTSSGSSTDSGGEPISCAQAATAQECANAHPEFPEEPPCAWIPYFAVSLDDEGVCSFEPAGGVCAPFEYGDTHCGFYELDCGYSAYGGRVNGTLLVTRVEDECEYYPATVDWQDEFECNGEAEDTTGGGTDDEDVVCACACSPDYPD